MTERLAIDFEPDRYWCESCSGVAFCDGHNGCTGIRDYPGKCECPCNGKLTREERFSLRKLLAK